MQNIVYSWRRVLVYGLHLENLNILSQKYAMFFVSLFNKISNFVGYIIPKPSL